MPAMISVVITQEVVMVNIVQNIVVQRVVVPLRLPSVPTIAHHTNVCMVPAITEEVDMVCIAPNTPVLTQVVQAKNQHYLIIA